MKAQNTGWLLFALVCLPTVLLPLVLGPPVLVAQTLPGGPAIDTEVHTIMDRTHAKGLALAVIDRGKVAYVQSYGVRNAQGDPLTTDTVTAPGAGSGVPVIELVSGPMPSSKNRSPSKSPTPASRTTPPPTSASSARLTSAPASTTPAS